MEQIKNSMKVSTIQNVRKYTLKPRFFFCMIKRDKAISVCPSESVIGYSSTSMSCK